MAGLDPDRPLLPERTEPFMKAVNYKQAIDKLGLSQVRAARFLGVSDRQGQRWARGEAEVPPTVSHLIRLMLEFNVKPGHLDDTFSEERLRVALEKAAEEKEAKAQEKTARAEARAKERVAKAKAKEIAMADARAKKKAAKLAAKATKRRRRKH